ncbi:adenylylsulfatase HINT3-like [Vigna unguiculata]|uniref:adenylylsulfatase HINT3-like n=1 Tax=Vigna unguiculata TaxID=3917 RepID=UPI0010162B0A|nr:adenylylsulfatase HINT3-like [Vigna unguiculata]
MMIEPPHHMYRPLLWISHTNSNKTPKLKPHHVLFLPFSSLHSQTPLIDSQTHHHTMSVQARRLAVFCAHLNPTRLPLDPPAPFLSPSLCAPHSDTQNDCVFCNIIRGQSPALKLYEDDMCLCILDTSPLSHGHSLIIPKSHFPSLDATPPSVVAAMFSKVPFISNAIMKATGCSSFNLLVNNGAAAGQVIYHTHIHIIPRKAYDCLWASESLLRRRVNLDDEKVSQLAARIQKQLLPSDMSQESKNENFCSSKS